MPPWIMRNALEGVKSGVSSISDDLLTSSPLLDSAIQQACPYIDECVLRAEGEKERPQSEDNLSEED